MTRIDGITPIKGREIPALVVAANSSHAGKTVTTLALLCALRERGLRVHAGKAGPDYIDTAYHAALTGYPAANLDVWMCGRKGVRRLLARLMGSVDGESPDLVVIEGVMGLFDGGGRGAGSTAQLASFLDLPILLLLRAAGVGQSIAAMAQGFLAYRPGGLGRLSFAGMACTHVGGERHVELLRGALRETEKKFGVPVLGMLRREDAPDIASRHLGLVSQAEALPAMQQHGLARWFEECFNVDALLSRLGTPVKRNSARPAGHAHAARMFFPALARHKPARHRPVVGIARDAAFEFCYADLPAVLTEMGAEILFFSPLADAGLPPGCTGLYFPGGYPELFAEGLSRNAGMRQEIVRFAAGNFPIYGECGGFIYLMQSLVGRDGRRHPMCGLLPLSCRMEGRWSALGYRQAFLARLGTCKTALRVRGHEFHYGRLEQQSLPDDCKHIWQDVKDSFGRSLGPEGCCRGSVAGSWLHLAPEGARPFWRKWLDRQRVLLEER